MNRVETLEKALDAVNRRPKSYGPPEQNFDRIAARWNAHLWNRYGMPAETPEGENLPLLDVTDVAVMCADIKLARLEETPDHEDSWIDLAGYAACGAEVSTAEMIEDTDWWKDAEARFRSSLGEPLTPPGTDKAYFDASKAQAEKEAWAKARADEQAVDAAAQAAVERPIAVGDKVAYWWTPTMPMTVVHMDSGRWVDLDCSCGEKHTAYINDLVKIYEG